jgi:uncharacterized protein (TIGR02001 family)
MKLKQLSALCLAASTMVATSSVMAEESAWSTSANIALGTEYVWRGISQTGSDPAISGGFDIAHTSGFYAGTWASNVDFGDADIEIDYYAGFGGEFGESGVSYDAGVLYYDYPSATDYDFTEAYLFLGYSFLSAGVSYTFDADDKDWEDGVYYQLDASYEVGDFTLAAGVGYYDFDTSVYQDYTSYYVGASTEFAGLGIDLTYYDTDSDGEDFSGVDNDTLVLTISKSM